MAISREGYEKILYIQYLVDFKTVLESSQEWNEAVEDSASIINIESKETVSLVDISSQLDEKGYKKKEVTFSFRSNREEMAVTACGINENASDFEKIVVPAVARISSDRLFGKLLNLQFKENYWFGFKGDYFGEMFFPWLVDLKKEMMANDNYFLNGKLNPEALKKINDVLKKKIKGLSIEEKNFYDKLHREKNPTKDKFFEVSDKNNRYVIAEDDKKYIDHPSPAANEDKESGWIKIFNRIKNFLFPAEKKNIIPEGSIIKDNQAGKHSNANFLGKYKLSFFSNERKEVKLVNDFLQQVSQGKKEAIIKMLKKNPSLATQRGNITDSKGVFEKVTAFQYALWTLNEPICEIFLSAHRNFTIPSEGGDSLAGQAREVMKSQALLPDRREKIEEILKNIFKEVPVNLVSDRKSNIATF